MKIVKFEIEVAIAAATSIRAAGEAVHEAVMGCDEVLAAEVTYDDGEPPKAPMAVSARPEKDKPKTKRRSPTFSPRVCINCHAEYTPTGATQRLCPACLAKRKEPSK